MRNPQFVRKTGARLGIQKTYKLFIGGKFVRSESGRVVSAKGNDGRRRAANPVASSHFNFTMPEPTGVVVVVCPDESPLLALVSLVAPVILAGNTAVVLASPQSFLPRVDVFRDHRHKRLAGWGREHPRG